MQKSNFHTHTLYSDGHNTPVGMIEAALGFGFTALGFSDHSYTHADESYPMKPSDEKAYFSEINALKKFYDGRIRLYCGIEQDGESCVPEHDYDYLIASVHELIVRGKCYPIDSGEEMHCRLVNEGFGGSFVDMSLAYFDRLVEHVMRNKTDFVGHFDLVTKYSMIPEEDPRYIDGAIEAIREIMKHCRTFELNTGAIARGLRTVPYPAGFMVDEIKRLGGRIIMTSDCHYCEKLTVWFDEGERFLAEHGFAKNEHASLNDRVGDIEIWE